MIDRFFVNILSDDLAASSRFYVETLGMKVHFESDWFIILVNEGRHPFELGILKRTSEIVPESDRQTPQGLMLTFVVEDVEQVYADAQARGLTIVEPPRNLFYGQRRLLLRDPNGVLIDVSTPSS
ncbi:MAG: VOC family protein [Pseudomonadota bacterium]